MAQYIVDSHGNVVFVSLQKLPSETKVKVRKSKVSKKIKQARVNSDNRCEFNKKEKPGSKTRAPVCDSIVRKRRAPVNAEFNIRCPDCELLLESAKSLIDHLKFDHGRTLAEIMLLFDQFALDKDGTVTFPVNTIQTPKNTHQAAAKKQKPPVSGNTCPQCGVVLKSSSRLKKHIRLVHEEKSTQSKHINRPSQPKAHISTSRGKPNPSQHREDRVEQNPVTFDGSRGIGYFARETGRYGSYPSHDDYGDESSAD